MQQIAAWLEKLGVPEYTQRLVKNGIDLCHGSRPQGHRCSTRLLGHRRKLLRAMRTRLVFVFSRHRSRRCIVLSQEVDINLSISNTHGLSSLKLMAAQFILL